VQKTLGALLSCLDVELANGCIPLSPVWLQLPIGHVTLHSKEVTAGSLFIALKGTQVDAKDYIPMAISLGAGAVFVESRESSFKVSFIQSVPVCHIPDLEKRLGLLAAYFFDTPSPLLKVIGITGTNGKTTSAYWLGQSLELLKQPCELIGTLGVGRWNALVPTLNTTPSALFLQRFFYEALCRKTAYIAMEVSSHGLELGRVVGTQFEVAVLTNLTQDHLDFHGTMEAYALAKEKLFFWPNLKKVVLNIDDAFGCRLAADARLSSLSKITYSLSNADATIYIQSYTSTNQGTLIHGIALDVAFSCLLPTWGRYNVSNFGAVAGTLLSLGYSISQIVDIVPFWVSPPGRLMRVLAKPLVFIDYAHTPDSLENVLKTLRPIVQGRLWCVFGCGGNRDRDKRPQMGQIAASLADQVVLTDDNPRFESSLEILNDILSGIDREKRDQVRVLPDRYEAIFYALKQAQGEDVLLIAGKGHETYQEIQGVRTPFSDQESVEKAYQRLTEE
jgi:UDP-N-acetylmuramoyl-L-alanyl-D-glutamate--2,6-diaminopimelate ligase